MAWPETKLDVFVEMFLGGQFRDISSDVYGHDRADVVISRGKSSEAGRLEPTRLDMELNNRDGRYSPRNPRSPWFGTFGRNTPVRVWGRGPETYLWIPGSNGQRGRTASKTSLDVASDLDVRIELSLDRIPTLNSLRGPQVNELMGRYNATGTPGNRSWRLLVDRLGQPTLGWSTNGDDYFEEWARTPLPVVSGQRFALRATLDVDNGAGGHTVTFYTAPTLAGPWEQHGDPQIGDGITSVHAPGDASFELGDINTINFAPGKGRYYRAELRDGIDGPLLASPDFTQFDATAPPTTADFTDAQGNVWQTTGGALITPYYRRFRGEMSEYPTRWDAGGADVWTEVQAAGYLRRLGQGAAPLKSPLTRRIPAGGEEGQVPVAYWPMEEGRAATAAYSPLEGVAPLRTLDMNWSANSDLFGSEALPTLGPKAYLSGSVPGATAGGWHVDLAYQLDELPATERMMLRVYLSGSPAAYVQTSISAAGVRIEAYDSENVRIANFLFTDPDALADFTGGWNRLQMFSAVVGGQTYVHAYWRGVITGATWYAATEFSGDPGAARRVYGNWHEDLAGMAIGHLGVWDIGGEASGDTSAPGVSYFDDADDGFEGESAYDRIRRLAAEDFVLLIATGDPSASLPVGPQRIATVLDNIEDAAGVDGGMLIEQRETLGLAYLGRDVFYNPTPALELDYRVSGEVMQPFEPVDDDQQLRNDVTVQRDGGSSAHAVLTEGPLSVQAPPDGAGVYDDSVTLNAATDGQLPSLAHWRLHLGTIDEARYPQVTVNLRTAPHLIERVLSMDVGSTIRIRNLPEWLPPGPLDLRVEGYREVLNAFKWEITFNCSPGSAWVVGTLAAGDGTDGTAKPNRADTAGSELAAAVDETATELLVHTQQGPTWVESAGPNPTYVTDFPFDVNAGGEVVRVSSVKPMVWDGFDRAVADGWGTTTSGTAWATSGTASDYSVDDVASKGQVHLAASQSTLRIAEIVEDLADSEQLCSVAVGQLPVGGDYLCGLFFRAGTVDGATVLYWCNLALQADGGVGLEVRNVVTPVGSRVATGLTFAPGTRVWLRARVDGHRVRGRVWLDGRPEPGSWHIDRTITTGQVDTGTVGFTAASTEVTTTPLFQVDDYQIATPQRVTVTRSVNGITKTHLAGTSVSLAQPAVVAL